MILSHGDNYGLKIPPAIAPIQIAIVVIDTHDKEVLSLLKP
jgi:prolyl-tRNA synthetase